MATKVRVSEKHGYGERDVITYKTRTIDEVGVLAFEFLEKWSIVAAIPDGEDSAGRSKLRLPTPEEAVTRAFDFAEGFMREAEKRGHTVELPDLNEVNAENDAKTIVQKAEDLISRWDKIDGQLKAKVSGA